MTAYNFVIDTGTVVEDTSTLLEDVQGEYQDALGANIALGSATPQGTLIAAETASRAWVMRNNAELANQINPQLASGVFLDAICALLGIGRGVNVSTVVHGVQFDGDSGTVIPVGSRVQTSNGDIFLTSSVVTIPSGGTVTGDIQSEAFGNVPAPTGTLTILDGVIGWGDAIINSGSTVVPGTTALNDAQLKIARNQRLATQGVGSSLAVLANLATVPNVHSALVVENNTGATGLVNGVTFTLPNALWACVYGGDQNAVAAALYASHQSGCPWDYGTSSGTPVNSPNGVTVQDPATGLNYNVKFTTPVLYDVYCHITVHQGINNQSSPVQAVEAAIMNYVNGLEDGEPGLVIGASISAYEYAGAVARQLPGMYVSECSIAVVAAGSSAPSYPSAYVQNYAMQPFGLGLQAVGHITVVVV
jgi:hypothetical protein